MSIVERPLSVSRRARRAAAACAMLALAAAPAGIWAGAAMATSGGEPPAQTQSPQGDRFPGWSGPKPSVPCVCRHADGVAALGDTVCLRRGGREVLARCEMAANNPFWRVLPNGCDGLHSSLSTPPAPTLAAGGPGSPHCAAPGF